MKKTLIICLLIVSLFSVTSISFAKSIDLGDILKVGGVSLIIKEFSGPLNNFINTLTNDKGVRPQYSTKVVPILSFGNGGYIGAAQVIGPKSLVNKTKAVIQIEGNFDKGNFRVKALVPTNSENPVHFSRVNGVGVSAIIDIRI